MNMISTYVVRPMAALVVANQLQIQAKVPTWLTVGSILESFQNAVSPEKLFQMQQALQNATLVDVENYVASSRITREVSTNPQYVIIASVGTTAAIVNKVAQYSTFLKNHNTLRNSLALAVGAGSSAACAYALGLNIQTADLIKPAMTLGGVCLAGKVLGNLGFTSEQRDLKFDKAALKKLDETLKEQLEKEEAELKEKHLVSDSKQEE